VNERLDRRAPRRRLKSVASVVDHLQRVLLRQQGYRERWIETSVGTVHAYETRGHGELAPFVLLHGFSASAGSFGPLMRRLRGSSRRLIAVDLPAHGWSDTPRKGMSYDGIRDGLFEALDQLMPFGESAHVLGNSMGGFAAIRYARARPERVKSLILVSPGGAAMDSPDLGRLRALFQMKTVDEALDFVDRLLAQRHPLRRLLAHFVLRQIRRKEMQALIRNLQTIELLKSSELEALSMPVLFIWGEKDKILPEESRQFFLDHLPDSSWLELPPHFGHSPQLEVPNELARMVLGFSQAQEAEASPQPRLVALPGGPSAALA
jgi:pimeloyl-ACP methyl ester carboxylesterase